MRRTKAAAAAATTTLLLALASCLASLSAPVSASVPSSSSDHHEPRSQITFHPPSDGVEAQALQRVNVTLGVMSRCPDALACEAVFDKVLDRVNAKTRLTMSYIGTPDTRKQHHKYGVECKHGDGECAGNIQQLCVQDALNPQRAGDEYDLSPSAAQKLWWNFIQCQNFAGLGTVGDESQAQRCLKILNGPGWDKDGIASCAHGSKGRKLLRNSVVSSRDRNISLSCTILIEGKTRCIRDGGSWKNCDMGHEVSDFVAEIERAWLRKNQKVLHLQDDQHHSAAASSATTRQASHSLHHDNTLSKRQAAPSSTGPDGTGFLGSTTPPSVFTLIIAIALFVLVVCFVLLRIIVRNRRLRRLGLLPDGPFDRILGPTREIEDTLVPPKLLEARIAHDFRPTPHDSDTKTKGWDAVMPISAALPPTLYSDLFPGDPKQVFAEKEANANGISQQDAANNDFSYPPPSSPPPGRQRRMHVPSFLRRSEHASGEDTGASNVAAGDAQGDGGEGIRPGAEESCPASVNVTVLIAMPSPRTVFPTAQSLRRNPLVASRPSLTGPNIKSTAVVSQKLEEVDENENGDESRPSLRRTASIKSFRTAASNKSLGDARREAFFNNMAKEQEQVEDLPPQHDSNHHAGFDDDEEEELPELVFGTASVPIFSRGGLVASSAAAPTLRQPFVGAAEAFQPVRGELMELVRAAHDARKRKERLEEAAKTEKDGNNDDGQTTLDERSANQAPGVANVTNAAATGGEAGSTVDHHRLSASETIDSEAGAAVGGAGISAINATRQEGLGDVVSRMMMPSPTAPQHQSHGWSSIDEPRPSVGMSSIVSRDDATGGGNSSRGETPTAVANTSSLTLDPLLGDNARPYTVTGSAQAGAEPGARSTIRAAGGGSSS
ncbi:hypothetical protein BCV70DRAFT_199649 [Testicularia cyperi]|uniref:Uncharacterized protein n=1 Tax=Testicularia cyperi TaxID=1882483 RepID=A0A317XSS7_9BASI|nr:hypothetical protein BCV70DRAFT_199649 [Testicularia cyperi]